MSRGRRSEEIGSGTPTGLLMGKCSDRGSRDPGRGGRDSCGSSREWSKMRSNHRMIPGVGERVVATDGSAEEETHARTDRSAP